ncbi:MAG: serine/threonine protein phosphatase, partial [Lachnospiraceae bacterium]
MTSVTDQNPFKKRAMHRLKGVLNASKTMVISPDASIVFMSDCHRGQNTPNDNFTVNAELYNKILLHYYEMGFTYIELGDGEELWENKDFSRILSAHRNTYTILDNFYKNERLIMLCGNHDLIKCKKQLYSTVMPHLKIQEGLLLELTPSGNRLFLIHGHQADFFNDVMAPLVCFLVRYVWKPLEILGLRAPYKTGCSISKSSVIEQSLCEFSKKEQLSVIAGHTHHTVFPKTSGCRYYNDGCCVWEN